MIEFYLIYILLILNWRKELKIKKIFSYKNHFHNFHQFGDISYKSSL